MTNHTVTSKSELDILDGLVLQLAIEAELHLLELFQEPDGNDHDEEEEEEPDSLALLYGDFLLLPLAFCCDRGKERHLIVIFIIYHQHHHQL